MRRSAISSLGCDMRRSISLVAVSAAFLLAACGSSSPGSSSPGGSSGSGGSAAPGTAAVGTSGTGTPAPTIGPSTGGTQEPFGGDPCSALTKAEIEAATYPQGPATFDSTSVQKDADTGKAVVCQYSVKFADKPATVGVTVSLLSDSEYGNRNEVSLVAPPEALTGIGSEAFLVQAAPGLFEVYVSAAHGKFKVGALAKDTAIAMATIAAARN